MEEMCPRIKKDKCFGVYKTAGEKTRSGGYTPIHPAGAVALNANTDNLGKGQIRKQNGFTNGKGHRKVENGLFLREQPAENKAGEWMETARGKRHNGLSALRRERMAGCIS